MLVNYSSSVIHYALTILGSVRKEDLLSQSRVAERHDAANGLGGKVRSAFEAQAPTAKSSRRMVPHYVHTFTHFTTGLQPLQCLEPHK